MIASFEFSRRQDQGGFENVVDIDLDPAFLENSNLATGNLTQSNLIQNPALVFGSQHAAPGAVSCQTPDSSQTPASS